MTCKTEIENWLALRKLEALRIDPETAEVNWSWGEIMDPYGVDPDLPEELRCLGRVYFARRPAGDTWVCFYDLSDESRERLWQALSRRSALPADLDLLDW